MLHLDEEKSLELAKDLTLEKVAEMVRSQGALQGVMTCTMLSMSAHLTKELGMAPGGEFRRAYREAKEVPGCLVHLGDRPIQITLKRAFGRYAQNFTELTKAGCIFDEFFWKLGVVTFYRLIEFF